MNQLFEIKPEIYGAWEQKDAVYANKIILDLHREAEKQIENKKREKNETI